VSQNRFKSFIRVLAVNRCYRFRNILVKSHYRGDQNVSRELIAFL